MVAGRQWTPSEAARLLRRPRHRLIYQREKEAVHPDFVDARGRESSPRFSSRNLLENSVGLQLRSLDLSADAIKTILHPLRAFEGIARTELFEFDIVGDERRTEAPDLRVVVAEGPRNYFFLGGRGREARVFGGVEPSRHAHGSTRVKVIELAGGAVSPSTPTRVEVTVTEVARPP